MSEFNIQNLISLTENGEIEKAAEQMADYLNSIEPEDRGDAYVALAGAYTKLIADNKQELAQVLESQLLELKKIDAAERAELEAVDLELARNLLK